MSNKKYNRNIVIGLLLIGLFVSSYYLTVYFYPNLVYKKAIQKLNVTENTLLYGNLPNATFRQVVKPNPDFLYVIGNYNLSEGDLQLTGTLPDSSYWSLAFYSPNTVNFYIKNDQQFDTNELNIVITESEKEISDTEVVVSPSTKGCFLFRILVTDNSPEIVAHFKEYQERIQLKLLE